jgi:ornithine cyclodeaminase/alanine dehydrogenase-like protein (mu-crystallin family)
MGDRVTDNGRILYLTRSDVIKAGVPVIEMIDEVERCFREWDEGALVGHPKVVSLTPAQSYFYSLNAYSPRLGLNLSHNSMGIQADLPAPPGQHHLTGMEVLSDYQTARPLALIDSFWMSTWISAAVSGLVARRYARPDAAILGLIATGTQARVHLPALKAVLPGLTRATAYNRSRAGAESFAVEARAMGWTVDVVDRPRAAAEADVIVTSIPFANTSLPIVDPAWVKPGAFVSAVDLGRSWLPGADKFERLLTDDHDQAKHEIDIGRFKILGPFEVDLKDLATGRAKPRGNARERVILCHSGHAVGVLGLAALVYRYAMKNGVGTWLPANWR